MPRVSIIEAHRAALKMLPVFVLIVSCLGQGKGGVDQTAAVPMLQNILSNARISGSFEYWGVCDIGKQRPPEIAQPRSVSGNEGSALGTLQAMFADDMKMRVTLDDDGKIRMVETDIPKDFLDVKIHHLSFPSDYHSGPFAVYYLLNTPEVRDFMNQNIGPKVPWGGWGMPGQIVMHGPSVPGELNDVTVAQALDYILQTFPGIWTYQDCYTAEGLREISVGFLPSFNHAFGY